TAPLRRFSGRLYVSPASMLEIQFLLETGRVRLKQNATVLDLAADDRCLQDDPPSAAWFAEALTVGWTHDPFDRLIVAHARLRRWRLATGDRTVIEQLPERERLEL